MKQIITLSAILFCMATGLIAQPHSVMTFAGPSHFGVESMDAWQDNESDTILFMMTSGTEADITIPSLTYEALNYTIPSFTIHGAKFAFNMTTHNAEFAEQTFSETIVADGEEKTVTGISFSATYNGAARQLSIRMVMKYGRMPLPVMFTITADYVSPSSAIDGISADENVSSSRRGTYTITGSQVAGTPAAGIYVVDGKKVLVR